MLIFQSTWSFIECLALFLLLLCFYYIFNIFVTCSWSFHSFVLSFVFDVPILNYWLLLLFSFFALKICILKCTQIFENFLFDSNWICRQFCGGCFNFTWSSFVSRHAIYVIAQCQCKIVFIYDLITKVCVYVCIIAYSGNERRRFEHQTADHTFNKTFNE